MKLFGISWFIFLLLIVTVSLVKKKTFCFSMLLHSIYFYLNLLYLCQDNNFLCVTLVVFFSYLFGRRRGRNLSRVADVAETARLFLALRVVLWSWLRPLALGDVGRLWGGQGLQAPADVLRRLTGGLVEDFFVLSVIVLDKTSFLCRCLTFHTSNLRIVGKALAWYWAGRSWRTNKVVGRLAGGDEV